MALKNNHNTKWRSIFLPSCFKINSTHNLDSKSHDRISKQISSTSRISLSDISDPGSSDLSNSWFASNLHIFTLNELKVITNDFSSTNLLGEGGFGPVHKGFVDDKCRPGLKAQPVAVKLLDLDGDQGHREWLDFTSKVSDFGLAKDGPEGDDTHVSTRIMGTHGYAAPEYVMTGHLTTMTDVYSFGVVLLELLTGKRAFDKSRPSREQHLVEWAKPYLKDHHKLDRLMDPRLEGQYSTEGAKKVVALARQCLSHYPKSRPDMSHVVKILERVMEFTDIPLGSFVYTTPTMGKIETKSCGEEENETKLKGNENQENGNNQRRKGYRHKHKIRPRAVYSDTALYKTIYNKE
ncbi:hypothetical protein ACJIZ3_020530 [Penstemon smallii]|uniref:Protein kinase domain-containing protein n=1 Tax=Penstemon smallii TaxID=265156 RepID=A0ABD3SJA5_9LAMI